MGSISIEQKPHAVCVPYPAQGHVNPMLAVAKLLHRAGFHVTFVNTHFNHNRILKSRGPTALDGLPSFHFESIPDGLPPSDTNATQNIPDLCRSTTTTCLAPFRELLSRLNKKEDVPPVTCIVSDGVMSFTVEAAEEMRLPVVLFWTPSACGILAYMHFCDLIEKGVTPLKDPIYLTNGYLDTTIDWIPSMKGIRLKDFPSFLRTTDPNDFMLEFILSETERGKRASAIIINTIEDLEQEVINSLSSMPLPPIYTIGPLNLLTDEIKDENLTCIGSNLWREETECLSWLDSQEPGSVVYVNFGSITVMTPEQLVEFAWGLADSNQVFLWVIRPDLVTGESAVLPPEFLEVTRERGMLASWCPQELVLNHSSVGGFLTHNGWNSTLESISRGVPMICWPFFAEQQTNCWYCCNQWGIGMEIEGDVRRGKIETLVRELMTGEKGGEMKKKAGEWMKMAKNAITPTGSSYQNLSKLIDQVLLSPKINK